MTHLQLARTCLFGLFLGTAALIQGAAARPESASLDRTQIKRLVVEEAEGTRVPPALALALAKVESDFQGGALSDRGARGVMQIMPRTAATEFGVGAEELWDPRLNIQLGLSFLEQLHERYGGRWDLALSHYNGGSLRGIGAQATAHAFNRHYVRSVLRWRQRYADQALVWRDPKPGDAWTPARTVIKAVRMNDGVARDGAVKDEFGKNWRPWRRRGPTGWDGARRQPADLDDFTSHHPGPLGTYHRHGSLRDPRKGHWHWG